MKDIIKGVGLMLCCLIVFQPINVSSSEIVSAKIRLHFNKSFPNLLFIKSDKWQIKISCHTDSNWNYVLPLESSEDKAFYAMLLGASIAGKSLTLRGTGECSAGSINTIEKLNSVFLD
jgi:hypothetical protein